MPKNTPFELFKQDTQQSQSTIDVLNSLEQNQFSLAQLHELIHCTPDNQNRSLLVVFFLNKLKEDERLFSTLVNRLFSTHPYHPIQKIQHQEDCLVFAIYCFLNGSQKKGQYLSYINLLTAKLLNQYYPFSLQSLKGLTLLLLRAEIDSQLSEQLLSLLFCHKMQEDKSPFAQVLQAIGLQGGRANYQQVIDLSQWALTKLDPHKNKHIIANLQTAIEEASLELEISQHTDFFSQLIGHFKRCFSYGWSGFFTPNAPTYVKLADPDLIEDIPVFAKPMNDFYSVAHFDLLVETTLLYSKEQAEINLNPFKQMSGMVTHFQLMELLFVNDFHQEIQEILHKECHEETFAACINHDIDKQNANEEYSDTLEIDEDSPFYGLIDPSESKSIDSSQNIAADEHDTNVVDTAKDFTDYAMEGINATKELVDTATGYAGQVFSGIGDVPAWTSNLFFSVSKPLLCTISKSIEEKPASQSKSDRWV